MAKVDNCEEHDGDGGRGQDEDGAALLLPVAKWHFGIGCRIVDGNNG